MGGKRYVPFVSRLTTLQPCRAVPHRNAAKARAKDSIGNAQRSFFGKQKLGILTKGLSKSYNRNSGENAVPSSRGLPEISLAHAHRDLSSRMEPGVIGLSTPRKHGQTRPVKPQEDTSSSGPRGKSSGSRSKILRALDMSERAFLLHPLFSHRFQSQILCSSQPSS